MTATETVKPDGDVRNVVEKLYQYECEYGSCPARWASYSKLEDEEKALEDALKHAPIVHRHVKSRKGGWHTLSFTINSLHMRALIAEALAKYQDFEPELAEWTFTKPYKPLVHRWGRLQTLHQEAQEAQDDSDKKTAADQLIKFLEPRLAPWVEALSTTQSTGKIAYEMLWQIFPPGELVNTKFFGADTICRVVKYEERPDPPAYIVTLEYVDWNGERCGYQTTRVVIPWFGGFRRVNSLPAFPLSFLPDQDAVRETTIARGRQFQKLRGFHYLNYSGVKISMTSEQRPVSGRVVVDAYAYYRSSNAVAPDLRSLTGEDVAETKNPDGEDQNNDDENHDTGIDDGVNQMVVVANSAVQSRNEDLTELSDEQCLLTTPWVVGLDMKTKEWGRFHVDNLEQIVWNDKAFENLVLPGGEKELAWEFVESKATSQEDLDDFVAEKGRGIIILMFGPPGVGKTYTAEAVAEKARVPLYSMGAGVLGTNPSDVEAALDHALELCRLWNAMLLLDEADVFLGARTNDGLARNELVSIFLTKLEYYQGILFLTTNRFSSIDHAFQSRVDLFLPYRDLSPAARKQVWLNFFEHFGMAKFEVTTTDLDRLAELSLNGREIKNLIKSAQLLSARSGGKVTAAKLYMLADKRVQALKMLAEQEANPSH